MPQKSLKQKAASGMVWTALQKYSTMFISFVSGIILARLLTPYDYGCIGMLSIFMVLAEAFIDGGFGSALIQRKQPTQDDYSTIFWWNLGMAGLMYAILFVSAPAISRFYNIPLLCDVLRVQGLVLFIYAFNIVQRNQLRKTLNFKVLSIVTVTTSIISLGVTIFMAYKGFGVWALVAQNMIAAAIPAVVFWFFIKWRPIWRFSWQSFRELFGFGFYMFMTHLVNTFCSKLNTLLIGKFYSPETLGYWSKALRTESLASNSISSVMTQVTYPLYVQVQDDKAAMANMVKRLTMTISYITFPIMAILMLTAKPIFVLLYSDRWLASIPYFQVLCLVGLSECLQAVNTQTIAAIGKSRLMFQWTLIKRTIGISFMVGGLYWFGMKGLLVGCVIYNWFCYAVNIGLVSKYIGYSWKQQLLDLFPVAFVTLLSAIISYVCGRFLHFSLYPDGLVKLLVVLLIYMGWSLLFKPESYRYFLTIIPSRLRIWEKKKQ
jgi:O-antigen/teichoic acid export membrane protein